MQAMTKYTTAAEENLIQIINIYYFAYNKLSIYFTLDQKRHMIMISWRGTTATQLGL